MPDTVFYTLFPVRILHPLPEKGGKLYKSLPPFFRAHQSGARRRGSIFTLLFIAKTWNGGYNTHSAEQGAAVPLRALGNGARLPISGGAYDPPQHPL